MQESPENNVQMVAPEMVKKTRMVASKQKSYKIKIVRDCEVELADGTKRIAVANEVLDVTKSCAQNLLGTKIDGYYTHAGESMGAVKEAIFRAVPFKGDDKEEVKKAPDMDLDSLYESL